MNVFDGLDGLAMFDLRLLGKLNATDLGLIRFDQPTPWERHRSEELLLILAGEVDVYLEGDDAPTMMRPGDLCVVPADRWHRQVPKPEVTLLFATEGETTDHKPYEG